MFWCECEIHLCNFSYLPYTVAKTGEDLRLFKSKINLIFRLFFATVLNLGSLT